MPDPPALQGDVGLAVLAIVGIIHCRLDLSFGQYLHDRLRKSRFPPQGDELRAVDLVRAPHASDFRRHHRLCDLPADARAASLSLPALQQSRRGAALTSARTANAICIRPARTAKRKLRRPTNSARIARTI